METLADCELITYIVPFAYMQIKGGVGRSGGERAVDGQERKLARIIRFAQQRKRTRAPHSFPTKLYAPAFRAPFFFPASNDLLGVPRLNA